MKNAITTFVVTAIVLTGCATVKQATLSDGSKGFVVACGGTAVTWSKCYEQAAMSCPDGFEIIDKEQFVHGGFVKRNLYFTCKNEK